jgi:putative tryptophan/tyrosine transport system substrate-binding protein
MQSNQIQRRLFVAALGSTLSLAAAARAQERRAPVIGFLSGRSQADSAYLLAVFEDSIYDAGFDPTRRVIIRSRWADGQYDRLPGLARELVALPLDLLVAVAGESTVQAAREAADKNLPFIFVTGRDPTELGLVKSLARPGGHTTGVVLRTLAIGPKRLDLLRQIVPNSAMFGILANPTFPQSAYQVHELEEASRALSLPLQVVQASEETQLAAAFDTLVRKGVGALLVTADPFYDVVKGRITSLAAERRLPSIYHHREYPAAGGLMSYGINLLDVYRLLGDYAGKILKGASPATLPIQQLDRIEFILNVRTAKHLGLQVPNTLLAFANELISE